MLPDEYFEQTRLDTFVIKLNKGVRFSLLDSPGKYSVRVATFRAASTISSTEIKSKKDEFTLLKQRGKGTKSKLDQCMNNANILTKALRKTGVEAWEFHDREESYVCVGSFDWLTRTDANGTKIQNPEIRKTILEYRGTVKNAGNQSVTFERRWRKDAQRTVNTVHVPKVLPSLRNRKKGEEIVFDVQPLPVIVPKAPQSMAKRLLKKLR